MRQGDFLVVVHGGKSAGYTLIELMAVLSIASTLLLIALPSFQTQMRNGRLTSASIDLLSTYMHARAEASARGNFVTVCIRNEDATACVK
ncbi:MAG: type IV fimbrial biogenesis protein FimT, partial [Bacteroidia bacterium]